jgi:hypothetical protein
VRIGLLYSNRGKLERVVPQLIHFETAPHVIQIGVRAADLYTGLEWLKVTITDFEKCHAIHYSSRTVFLFDASFFSLE